MRLRPNSLADADGAIALYALRILLAVAGGASQLPDETRTATLHARLAAEEPVRSVLSRTLVDRRKAGIFLLRETRDLPGGEAVRDGAIWDGRYRVRRPSPDAVRRPDAEAPRRSAEPVPDSLVRLAHAALPPLPPGWTATPVLAPWARYLPSFDMAPARAVAELIGAAEIPRPPLREHNERGA
jgi:tRNA(Ile)-lysidine synthase